MSDVIHEKYLKHVARLIIFLVVLFFVFSCGVLPFIHYSNVETTTITVNHKERTTSSNGKTTTSYYLIYAEDETLTLRDDMLYGQFNSSDIYGRINIGESYRVKVLGVRVPILSWYRNIVSVESVE